MNEEFLWYIWKFRLFDNDSLQTTQGEKIQILKVGEHNINSGPDFFNARIKVGNTEWAGNVEVHTHASDWHKHKHSKDIAYDNVILHTVYEADGKILRANGSEIPTLELKTRIPRSIYERYLNFKSNSYRIPCEKQITTVHKFIINNWLVRLTIERLERKAESIKEVLNRNKNNWEESFYQLLARSFGQKINSDPFEMLAKYLPISVLAKHKNSLLQLEALLFGVAGLLENDFKDEYPNLLKKEFKFLKSKFRLESLNSSVWKFMRLHPPNFPTIRIAQFANLIYNSSHLFSKVVEANTLQQLTLLVGAEAGAYWDTHYRFDAPSSQRKKTLGETSVNTILINTIVPFLFVYGKEKAEEKYSTRALSFLEEMKPEGNAIISGWSAIGITPVNAHHTGIITTKE